MKKFFIAAVPLAAVLALGGCSSTPERPTSDTSSLIVINSLSEPNASDSRNNSSSDASGVQANVSFSGDRVITENRTVAEGQVLTVRNGETLYINDGAEFTVDGGIAVENGGSIKVRSGGSLLLNGKMTLDGGLELGGFLGIREKGEINGAGLLTVLNSFDDIDCKGTCKAKIKAPEPVEKDGVTYVGGVLIVNKKYSVPEDYGEELGLVIDEAYDQLLKMREDTGFDMPLVSGYRSYWTQDDLFNYYCEIDDYDKVVMYSAEPGHSEHQTGLAMDLGQITEDYVNTEEGGWLTDNCHKYGFIIRYPKGCEKKTGYDYEPWHVRWLGESTARLVRDSGLTLEEFLGVEAM
ncbi:MAG: M15 family metallopeptidase [Oscillospiraceae bacterium]|nr:M15 family metallopeptidase [Oscillospiraceae bacterium]